MTTILIYTVVVCAAVTWVGLASGDVEHANHGGGGAHFGTPATPPGHDHFGTGHNVEFDHEAILGSEAANEEFASLPPHEAKRRLALLLLKMDLNGDGKIAKGELTAWILTNLRKQEESYAASKLRDVDADGDEKVSWSEYLGKIYGYTLDEIKAFENDTSEGMKNFLNMVRDDKEKFRLADRDKSGSLTSQEYAAFLYPYSYPHMHDHEVQRVLRDLDKNGDAAITFDEYLGKSTPGAEQLIVDKENFKSYDTDNDGKLTAKEIKTWVLPDQRVIAEDEAAHLISETDADKDGILTKDEILDRHDLWVGSSATDYGDRLLYHDDL